MQRKIKQSFLTAGVLSLLSVMFIVVVKTVDVQPIGPEQSSVGLAAVNNFIFDLFGVNLLWYHITDWLGVVSIVVAFCFALLGFVQLIKKRSLWLVDADLLLLGIFYLVVIGLYVLFEIFVVNYRPILIKSMLEASFPSSHTMIVFCIMSTAMIQFHLRLKNKVVRFTAEVVSALIILVTIFGRIISGVHWFTDVIGGLLIGSALTMSYYAAVNYFKSRQVLL